MFFKKICIVNSHATLACYKALVKTNPRVSSCLPSMYVTDLTLSHSKLVQHWEKTGCVLTYRYGFLLLLILKCRQAKIALKVNSDDQLLQLEAIAKSLNLCARSIQDQYVLFSRILHALISYFWNYQRTNAGRRNTNSLGYRTGACRINQRSDRETASSLTHSHLVCIFDMTLSKHAEMRS